MMYKSIFFTVLSALTFLANGQNSYDEIIHLSQDNVLPANFSSSPHNIKQKGTNFKATYGFLLNEKEDMLSIGAGYNYFELKNSLNKEKPLKIHNLSVGANWLKHWKNPYWGSTIAGGIAAISDFKTEDYSGYQTSLTGLVHYGRSNDLVWTAGLYYSDQPFGTWLFPVLGVDWRINKRLYFSAILFSKTYLEYALQPKKWYVGVDIEDHGQSFVLSSFEEKDNTYISSLSEEFPYYPYSVSIFSDWYIKKYYTFFTKVGYLVSRENAHFDANHNKIEESIYNDKISPSLYFKVGVAFRIRKFD